MSRCECRSLCPCAWGACPALGVASAAVCGGRNCSSAVVLSGGFMLCFASVMDHIWCTEPIYKSCTSYNSHFTCITYHGKLMSATNLHALTLHQGLMTIQVFLHRKYIPTSTNFSKLFLNSFSEKVLALNFFSSPLYHPPSLPAVYFLSPFLRGLSIAFSPEKCIT